MSRINERINRLERRPKATRGHIVMCWGDDDIVTDDDGRQMTLGEYQRLHPGRVIQMTWGDELAEA